MGPEDTTSPELEAMRSQVWQEIEEYWQKKIQQNPNLKNYDLKSTYADLTSEEIAEIDPKAKADTEASLRVKKIDLFLYNFSTDMPGKYSTFLQTVDPNFRFTDTHTIYSPLQYGKTLEQWNAEVAEAMRQMNLSVEDYLKLEAVNKKSYYTGLDELKYQETLLEIFIRLRLMNPNPPIPTTNEI